ncbi:hypothetical protein [Aquimarina sp. MMG016]|uniref:hypothetical protein n=1 Tax=Aquimarina sp. MMG016 TaxID=2822690 RepID=UPI001B3A0A66|nr:hypothetical protein [Aquimarina sp. MMG016]MBQ4821643.1 hypothetical protein [Aquimarina sp. MMG016]
MKQYIFLAIVLITLLACENSKSNKVDKVEQSETVEDLLLQYNQKISNAAKTRSFETIRDLYDQESLLMTDYNPLIVNNDNIKIYYDTIFARQNIKEYHRQTVDILEFTDKIIEIGLFTKVFENSEKLEGKYLNVWKKNVTGKLTIRAEAFGYLKRIDDPTLLFVSEASIAEPKAITIPRELDAYSTLGKSNVFARIPEKTADAYTDDAMYLPFADTIKTGKSVLLDHYKAYYHNPAKIDALELMTYAYDKVGDGYIKYGGFYVEWTASGFSGNAAGTGISYWRREKDNSLRIHRQIGLHK